MSDFDTYKLIGGGATSEVYSVDESRVLKLFKANLPRQMAVDEKERSEYLHSLGIPSPKIFSLYEQDGRVGIILENMGPVTVLNAVTRHPEKGREYGRMYGELAKAIHTHTADQYAERVIDIMQKGFQCLKDEKERSNVQIPEGMEQWIARQLQAFPEDSRLLHGDLSPGNVMLKDGKLFVIDAMTLRLGPAVYDYLPCYMFTHVWPVLKELSLKMTEQERQARPYWAEFLKPYEKYAVCRETAHDIWEGFLDAVCEERSQTARELFTAKAANMNYLKYAVTIWNLEFMPEGKRAAISQWAIGNIDVSLDIF